jgi:hypothetical protein
VRQSVDVGPVTRGLRPGLVKRMWPLPSVSTDQPRLAPSLARSRSSLLARLVRPGFFFLIPMVLPLPARFELSHLIWSAVAVLLAVSHC